MNNIKQISMVALFLLIVGTVGSILTFKTMTQSKQVSEEKAITEDYTKIDVKTNNAKIEILPSNNSTTTVELSGKVANNLKYSFTADVEGNTLSVKLTDKLGKLFKFDFFTTSLSLKVFVPEKQYDSIQIISNNGRIIGENLHAQDIIAETDNGRIELNNIKGSTVTTEADNGVVHLKNVVASTVAVEVDNGKILLDDIDGELSGRANNGSITLITNHLDRPINFDTDNGKIRIETKNEPTNATIDVGVDNGKVSIFGKSNRNVIFGNGEHQIKLKTNNGSITVTK
ncbi:DUF4097 family beta strand repeat-containing protein [Lederbergia citrea]|uniref:DUF4097 family beta strand repeat protein n=1 Tax=Lederbergia citrea TaxID=2833581 RepID=A0A942UW43_9BACI|nr:DUF4097 family beta strand repeat-containing protein [Lederbergia citrea]MBS4179076.1 DUF4097 family beta strand repeat protein [Lederbergia citrea]MBS4205735.1 DUF4097 family beta strand repeat protein [Lederbergia citrea]MBS4223929.1 DUF4097 family beta strand repeat protein [Lederbergia citrea]